jgi:uncharacterized peroxidase-related enzyme
MAFIETIPEDGAEAPVAAMYDTDRAMLGYLPNFTRAFSHRPAVYGAWRQLNGAIKAGMDERRYELATIAAARRLRSSYCMLAHGRVLANRFMDAEDLRTVASGGESDALDPVDVAVMEVADKVATDGTSVTPADIARLRDLGLSDADILDVVAAAAARCFFSTVLDALGVEPDAAFNALEPGLRDALTVGRPIASE